MVGRKKREKPKKMDLLEKISFWAEETRHREIYVYNAVTFQLILLDQL